MKDVHHYPYQSLQICSVDQRERSKNKLQSHYAYQFIWTRQRLSPARDLYLDIGARYAEMLLSTYVFRCQSKVKAS